MYQYLKHGHDIPKKIFVEVLSEISQSDELLNSK